MQIQAGAGSGSNRTSANLDSMARIAMLQGQVKGLLKKIEALRKALEEVTDPAARLAIMKEIIELQEQLRQAQAQIAELQARANRHDQPPPAPKPEPKDERRHEHWKDAYGP